MKDKDNKIGQLFIIGISGTELTKEEVDFIIQNNVGGVILFSRNCESPEQVHKICSQLQALRYQLPEKAPFFIGVDMEGGRVQRLQPPFTSWPSVRKMADLDSTLLAFNFARCMGAELKSVGINLNFAPCADILMNEANEVIGDRSPGITQEVVSKISSALARGYIKSDILPCAKHFPGHGNTTVDSHEELPVELADLETLRNRELLVFKKIVRTKIDLIMTAHIHFPNIDEKSPVTFSKFFLQDLIREELRYKGLIVSDDLDMGALSLHHKGEDIPIQALKAGCDILLYCNKPESPRVALESLRSAVDSDPTLAQRVAESYSRIMELKSFRLTQVDPPHLSQSLSMIGHPNHLKIVQAICEGRVPGDLPSK